MKVYVTLLPALSPFYYLMIWYSEETCLEYFIITEWLKNLEFGAVLSGIWVIFWQSVTHLPLG